MKAQNPEQSSPTRSAPPPPQTMNVFQRLSLPVKKGTYAQRASTEPRPRFSTMTSKKESRAPVNDDALVIRQMEDLRRENTRLRTELEKCRVGGVSWGDV